MKIIIKCELLQTLQQYDSQIHANEHYLRKI